MQSSANDNYTLLPFTHRYDVLKIFSLLFRDPGLERDYRADYANNVARQMRIALALALSLYVPFAYLDYLLVPESMWQLWTIRVVICTLLMGLFALTFTHTFVRFHQEFIILSSFVATAGILVMLIITRNEVNRYYHQGVNLCITWTLFIIGLRFLNSLGAITVIIVSYNVIALAKNLPLSELLTNNFFLSSNAVIGIFAGYTIELQSRWQFYQSLVIKSNSNTLHKAMIAASLDGIVSIDEAGNIVEFNHSAELMFGYSRAEALNQPVYQLIVPDAMHEKLKEIFRCSTDTNENSLATIRIELDAMRKDGSLFPVELTLREVKLIGRRLVTAYIRDLTSQRQAEAEIIKQREILQRSEKLNALGTLLAGVAHELNNPLSVVLGQSQLLMEIEQEPRILTRAGKICRAADRCSKIVSTFLDMARQKPPAWANVNINQVVNGALDLLDYGFRSRSIEVRLHLQDSLQDIHADRDQLHQVVTNILINAQQAMQNSDIRVITIKSYFHAGRKSICLDIIDTGTGVSADIHGKIFEPFFTTKPVGSGTGLGLSVCNGIIESHGGNIEVISPDAPGVCFRIYLPVTESSTLEENGVDDNVAAVVERQHVLVVDDETEILELIQEVLENAGFLVSGMSDGKQALQFLEMHTPDIILSDLRMPLVSGVELFGIVTERWPHLATQFIMMTGDVLTIDNSDLTEIKNLPILEKPFVPQKLLAAIHQLDTQREVII